MGATLIDPTVYEQAGLIPPQKKKGKKMEDIPWRKQAILKQLRILDEQTAVNRYKWTNLPCNISSQQLQRLLYYKGQLCFFYYPATQQFYFMPFALDGTIDFYGRYNRVHPVPMAYGTTSTDVNDAQYTLLSTIKLDVLYGLPGSEQEKNKWAQKFRNGEACVIVQDYTRQLGFMNISRQVLNDPLLDIMSDCIPFMRTSLQANTGIKGMRVPNELDYPNVIEANDAFKRAALEGDSYIPIVGALDFQELTQKTATKAQEYMLAMQSLDNYRQSLYGLESGGLFQKKEHVLQSEQQMNAKKGASAFIDGLTIRHWACDLINSITELGIGCYKGQTSKASMINEQATQNQIQEEDNNDEQVSDI